MIRWWSTLIKAILFFAVEEHPTDELTQGWCHDGYATHQQNVQNVEGELYAHYI